VEGNGIRIGLGALRGVGQEAIDAVIQEREKSGPFADFADFAIRCAKFVNKRIVESLIYAGAFDCFGYTRSQFIAVYEEVLSRVNALDKQKKGDQISLFGLGGLFEEQKIEIKYPDCPEYETMEKLSKEKSVLGVYVSGHPFEKFLPHFKDCSFNCSMMSDFTEDEETGQKTYAELSDGQAITMGGMISAYKKLQTSSGSYMAIVTVEDMYGTIECVCFPKIYDKIKGFMSEDRVVFVKGKISINDDKAPSIIVDTMTEFTQEEKTEVKESAPRAEGKETQTAPKVENKEKRLWLNITGLDDADVEELMETLCFYGGDTTVIFVKDGKKLLCSQKVTPNKALLAELRGFLSENCIKLA
jgi:DNA polymerase-3 subunit alpha